MTREEAIKWLNYHINITDYEETDELYIALKMAIKALEQEPKTGHWIRVDKTKVKCSECDITHFIAQYPMGQIKFCPNCGTKMAIEALEQKPCEDCISRKAVLDKINEICFSREQASVDFRVAQGSNGQRDLIINFIENLPSVQSKPKTEVLNKIRAEIDRQEKWLMSAGYNAYNVDIAFNSIRSVVKESEE